MKILILDDNKMNNVLLARMLKMSDKDSTAFTKGTEAVAAIEAARKKDEPFDVIFCDIIMPGGIDGYEVVKRIRNLEKPKSTSLNPLLKHKKGMVIVALTAMKSAKTEEKLIALGADHFISKPINKKIVIEILKQVAEEI